MSLTTIPDNFLTYGQRSSTTSPLTDLKLDTYIPHYANHNLQVLEGQHKVVQHKVVHHQVGQHEYHSLQGSLEESPQVLESTSLQANRSTSPQVHESLRGSISTSTRSPRSPATPTRLALTTHAPQ